ncbi:MAG: type II toxin-antitoxin system HicB family antitoxin [Methylotetracoccus sp.]|jgi:predicted RNase H-like HicB family nuclease|nr:type II toxin-antitoxin system HicB family antitoxin [Methylotetracoccus sp.]
MRYTVVIEQGPSSFGAFVPDLPGCIAAGETEDEVISLIQEAIQFHLEGLQRNGAPIPLPSSKSTIVDVPFSAQPFSPPDAPRAARR